jgi:hypothetical protein
MGGSVAIGFGLDVTCMYHGPMHYRNPMMWYDCIGFDGEGCPAKLTDEEVDLILNEQPILRACQGELSWRAGVVKFEGTERVSIEVTPAWNVPRPDEQE